MTRKRNLLLTLIVAAILLVFAALPDILTIDALHTHAEPGGNHGGP